MSNAKDEGVEASRGKAEAVFRRRKLEYAAVFLFLAACTVGSSLVTNFNFLDAAASFPAAFGWMAANFVPDEPALKNLPRIASKLMETLFVSAAATVCAALFSFVLAILGSKVTSPWFGISAVVRILASFMRNIPVVAWAMIFLFSFGQSTLTGFLALFIESVGFLTRAFVENIDETSKSSVEALNASGASRLQTIVQAVVPAVLPQSTSWTLYMIETNVRSATLVGILTGSGIGWVFNIYYRTMQYPSAAVTVMAIVAVVIALEMASNRVREAIL